MILRGRWCNIIVLSMNALCEDKSNDIKGNFCEQQGCVFDQFRRYDMTKFLDDFSAKEGSVRQSGTRFHTKLLIIMQFE
jgi:hypothetical protein